MRKSGNKKKEVSKTKRFLASFLAFSLVVGSMSALAFADDEVEEPAAEPAAQVVDEETAVEAVAEEVVIDEEAPEEDAIIEETVADDESIGDEDALPAEEDADVEDADVEDADIEDAESEEVVEEVAEAPTYDIDADPGSGSTLDTTTTTAAGEKFLTVCDGTDSHTNVPFYGFYADAYLKCHYIIPASVLSDMSGCKVSSMTFYIASPAAAPWTGTAKVYLSETTSETISAFAGTSIATLVYTGSLDGTGATMVVNFDNDYTYNGGNLLVCFENVIKGNYKYVSFYGTNSTGSCVQGYDYNSLDGIYPNQRDFLPKTTFGYASAHNYVYTADGATINVTCTNPSCTHDPSSASLTIVAPTLKNLGGEGDAYATLSGLDGFNAFAGLSISDKEIIYSGRGDTAYRESTTAPTEMGTYTASLTVKEKVISVDYEIAPPIYKFIDSDNLVFTKDSDTVLTFHATRSANDDTMINDLTGIEVDNTAVPEDACEVVGGSVIVKLKSGFLNGLSVGTHVLSLSFNDGTKVSAAFTVKAAPVPSAQTGEYAGPVVLVLAAALLAGGAVMTVKTFRKKED